MAEGLTDPRNANVDVSESMTGANVPYEELRTWIMHKVRDARQIRDKNYKKRWDQYERVYRGFYKEDDRVRESERSRLIAPALTQAIDSTAAAIEDAIFGRDQWFDLLDDVADQKKQDVESARALLKEDLEEAGVPEQIAKVILSGCIYGTGIGKINVIRKAVKRIEQTESGPKVVNDVRPLVTLDAIAPWEFVIDHNARTVDDALFCAHEMIVPKHRVWAKQASGVYRKVDFGAFHSADGIPTPGGEPIVDPMAPDYEEAGAAYITEYYGKVPKRLVKNLDSFEDLKDEPGDMVEAIVTIANENTILRAVRNPFLMRDRPIVAYQHNSVPGRFYGAGVSEKGWNAQKALDAELRARMDALGLLTAPMMGADITRLPRNPDMKVRPGKVWLTRGRPSEVLEPVILGNINPNTFNQSAEMERLVQVGTGSIDSNAPLDNNRRNETASGISMIQSSSLKRMRRTMWNLERQFLNPFVRKAYLRLMQFNPRRYPMDFTFGVKGTMGIVAREFEQANLTALLSVVPPEHPAYLVILRGIVELSGTPKRDELLQQIDAAAQPDPEQQQIQQMMQQIAIAKEQAELAKLQMEAEAKRAEAMLTMAKTEHEYIVAALEDDKIEIQAANAVTGREKARMAMRQNEIAAQRNRIEEIKVKKQTKGDK